MYHIAQAARRLTTGWTSRVRSRCRRGGDFSSFFRDHTGLEVHSASYKMSTGCFTGVKTAERRTSHPTSSQYHGCEYVDPCIHIPWTFMACNGDTFTFYLIIKSRAYYYSFSISFNIRVKKANKEMIVETRL